MKQKRRIMLLAFMCLFGLVSLLVSTCGASEDITYRVNLLPWSHHHGTTSATNERHKGIGLSMTLPSRISFGLMHFKNSYGDYGFALSAAKELNACFLDICPGAGIALAPSYMKSGRPPVIGWLSLRYKWVTVMSAPTEVTTIMLSVPIK